MPQNKGATIVYDLRSAMSSPMKSPPPAGIPRRDRVGHAFIKKTMADTKAVFGGELSGHFYFRDNFFADSGAIAFARVLSILSAQKSSLSQLMKPLHQALQQTGEDQFPGRRQGRQNPRTGGCLNKIAGRLSRRHHCRSGRLVVQRPQEQHRAAAAIEPGKQRLAELQTILGQPAHGH
jgi:phosphomannomutase